MTGSRPVVLAADTLGGGPASSDRRHTDLALARRYLSPDWHCIQPRNPIISAGMDARAGAHSTMLLLIAGPRAAELASMVRFPFAIRKMSNLR